MLTLAITPQKFGEEKTFPLLKKLVAAGKIVVPGQHYLLLFVGNRNLYVTQLRGASVAMSLRMPMRMRMMMMTTTMVMILTLLIPVTQIKSSFCGRASLRHYGTRFARNAFRTKYQTYE
jgi:hypothetical protein